jgi:hypothetical protein
MLMLLSPEHTNMGSLVHFAAGSLLPQAHNQPEGIFMVQ